MKYYSFATPKRGLEFVHGLEKIVPQSIDEVIESFAAVPKDIILSSEIDGLEFVEGTYTIEYINYEKVKLSAIMYFKDTNQKKWIVKENVEFFPLTQFTVVDQEKIRKEKKLSYEMVYPGN